MIVAIPVWQGLVSPVFDASRTVHIVRLGADGAEAGRDELHLPEGNPTGRISLLRESGVEVLICGAVSARLAEMITASGIRIIPFVTGNAGAVLDAFRRGELPSPDFAMPGCHGGRRRLRKGRGACNRRQPG